jgi:hypothetical protein
LAVFYNYCHTKNSVIILDPPKRLVVVLGMDPACANLIDHLNGVISTARVTWQSSGKCADIARIFRLVGRMHQAAALAQRDNPSTRLQISEDSIFE